MTERIQKIISASGLTSRRRAEEMILAGRVKCNGKVCELGMKADPETDVIEVDGRRLATAPQMVYILLNKPRGYVTTLQDEKGRKNAAQLVADCGVRVYPVGRLDMDSEGLLLFTNDGDFANSLMHPRHQVDKCYRVWVNGYTPENLRLLERPVELDGYMIQPPQVQLVRAEGAKAVVEVVIHEGRNRQVRRMCDRAGMQVDRLQRIAEGSLKLDNVPLGKWRYLTDHEVAELRKE